jgi:hypothetical protein
VRDSAAGAAPYPLAHGRGRLQQLLRGHYDTLAGLFDATTFRRLDRLGIAVGWRCWGPAREPPPCRHGWSSALVPRATCWPPTSR